MAPMALDGDTSAAVDADDLVIPLIDFSLFLQGSPGQKLQCAKAVTEAFKTSGFLYISNHGIPSSTVQNVFSHSAKFFARPTEEKLALSWTTPQSNRGYVAYGREKLTASETETEDDVAKRRSANPDLKETIEIGKEGVEGLPNQWPDRFDQAGKDFTEVMKEFFVTCKDLHVEVMRAIAMGMGLGDKFFDEYTSGGDCNLRLLHYPPVKPEVFRTNKGQVRAGEHSDYGSITLLFQDDRGGLQVRSPKGTFVNATPIKDTIVVNAGDLMARWANDEIKSTKHRVVEPPPKEGEKAMDEYPARYSMAFFCNPNYDKWIEALPGTWEEKEGGKKYPGVGAGEYLFSRLAATY